MPKIVASLIFAAVAVLTGCYYEWGVRATGHEFEWRTDLTGYYDYLARGFLEGHLYLPVEPDPRLLALRDPLDPNAGLDLPKMFDAVLYNRHYYLYHGVAPAVMLFLPWRVLTGHDLPEGFALFLLCFGGYLFAAGAARAMLRIAGVEIGPWALLTILLALAFCQSVPFLLNRVWVYEIAIGGGYFCVSAGLFFLARSMLSERRVWLVASGAMLGLAVACRPHLAIVAALATVALLVAKRRFLAFVAPFLTVAAAIGLYNFERFGNPLDFGLGYQITGPYQGVLHLRAANALPGLYYMLFTRPDFSNVFPWVLISWPPRSFPRPPLYFIEPIVGAFYLAPFLPLALAALFMRRLQSMRWVAVGSALAILTFLIATGLSTQRYEVDFLPLLVLASTATFGVWISQATGIRRAVCWCLMTAAVGFGMVVNLALGITGPYDELMKNKPERYIRIAHSLRPIARLRPELNPALAGDFTAAVKPAADHMRQDLFSAGRAPWRYELFIDHLNGKPVLVSRFGPSELTKEMTSSEQPLRFHLEYVPATREILVAVAGSEVFRQKIEGLVSAPAQIGLGAAATR